MSLIGKPRKGFNVSAYNKQKLERERKRASAQPSTKADRERASAAEPMEPEENSAGIKRGSAERY